MIYGIRVSGGVGDLVTYLARLGSLLDEKDKAFFEFKGGYEKIFGWRKELLKLDQRVITNLGFGHADRILDWRADYAPLGFKLKLPLGISISEQAKEFATKILSTKKKNCIIHPISATGNSREFEGEIARHRFWDFDKWQKLIFWLISKNFQVTQIGSKEDCYPFQQVINLCGTVSISESIALLSRADLSITTNSWPGLISAYALKPTIYFFFVDHQFIPIHFDFELSNLILYKDSQVSVEKVILDIEDRFSNVM